MFPTQSRQGYYFNRPAVLNAHAKLHLPNQVVAMLLKYTPSNPGDRHF